MPLLCSQVVMGSKYRAKLRKKFNLVEAPHGDCFSHVFCLVAPFVKSSESSKADRGLDPNLGEAYLTIRAEVEELEKKLDDTAEEEETQSRRTRANCPRCRVIVLRIVHSPTTGVVSERSGSK
ncbi:hypothetical protein IFM89_024704 [Coptis chinensis]|uniref:Uncharacterized protein n=1 Tax=Coptis chinensis TaxID=261450 RepID=A0A835M0Z2_9MAGN|nr:hypothetical protein IFM89_024704 [Coptis chinensis]